MSIAGISKFVLGFTLAIALLFFAGASATRFLITRLTAPPPKPIFPNDAPASPPASPRPATSPVASPAASPTRSPVSPTASPASPTASPAASSPSPETTASPSPTTASPSPTDDPAVVSSPSPEELPPGAYPARVTQSRGLVVRQEPSRESDRVGGVRVNQEVTVLEASDDNRWLRVRLEDGTEGWVRAGNTSRME